MPNPQNHVEAQRVKSSYYLPTLLIESVRLSDSTARLIAASSSVLYLVASGVAAPLVERYGRRTMMMVSTGIQLLCFLLLTILLALAARPGDGQGRTKVAAAAVVFFFIYYAGFGLGMLGIPWLYPTEINSLPMRTKGAAAAAMANWLTNFAVVEVTPVGLRTLGWRFYIVWTLTNAAFVPLIWLLYPETGEPTRLSLSPFPLSSLLRGIDMPKMRRKEEAQALLMRRALPPPPRQPTARSRTSTPTTASGPRSSSSATRTPSHAVGRANTSRCRNAISGRWPSVRTNAPRRRKVELARSVCAYNGSIVGPKLTISRKASAPPGVEATILAVFCSYHTVRGGKDTIREEWAQTIHNSLGLVLGSIHL